MPERDRSEITKRSVLQAAGTALTAGVAMTGTVAGDNYCDTVPCTCEYDCTGDSGCQISDCGYCDDGYYKEGDCDVWRRHCTEDFCLETTEEAEAYSLCPFDVVSHDTYIQKGRAGTIADICYDSSGCFQAVKVRFDCQETWWIRSDDLTETPDSNCVC